MVLQIKKGLNPPTVNDLEDKQLGFSTSTRHLYIRDGNQIVDLSADYNIYCSCDCSSNNSSVGLSFIDEIIAFLNEINGGNIGETITDKLNYLKETKEMIRLALNNKGANIPNSTPFREYVNFINNFNNLNTDSSDNYYYYGGFSDIELDSEEAYKVYELYLLIKNHNNYFSVQEKESIDQNYPNGLDTLLSMGAINRTALTHSVNTSGNVIVGWTITVNPIDLSKFGVYN